jgi:uncharacterized protein YpiB (UPF0302 family)
MRKKIKIKSEELMDRLSKSSEDLEYLREPYIYKGEGEVIKDISSGTPLNVQKEEIKMDTYKIKQEIGSDENSSVKMEMHFEYESINDNLNDIREDYVELIKEMRKAKYRNELVSKEIGKKYKSYNESLKSH